MAYEANGLLVEAADAYLWPSGWRREPKWRYRRRCSSPAEATLSLLWPTSIA